MLASWMAYASLVATALAIASLAFERLAATRRWPLRWIWAGALALSVALPIVSALRPATPAPDAVATMVPFTITVGPTPAATITPVPARGISIQTALIAIWAALSALALIRLSTSIVASRRRRRGWRIADVDGVTVHVSAADGPAVVGLSDMDIVLPEWILSLDAPLRALVLRHENEHRRARDPYLLFGSAIVVALMPWNLALWFLARRLRLALELDCDARVLCAHPSPERYGMLMLAVAQRRSATPLSFATMLSEPTTNLERRILAMQATRRMGRRATYTAATVALALVAFACTLRTAAPAPTTQAPANDPTFAEWAAKQGFQSWTTARVVPGNAAPHYPDELRAKHIEGSVLAQFAIDTLGAVDMKTFSLRQSSNELFAKSVIAAVPAMRFMPAEVDGKKVKQLTQMPFVFSLGSSDNAAMAALDTMQRTVPCTASGSCPVFRFGKVISVAAP